MYGYGSWSFLKMGQKDPGWVDFVTFSLHFKSNIKVYYEYLVIKIKNI